MYFNLSINIVFLSRILTKTYNYFQAIRLGFRIQICLDFVYCTRMYSIADSVRLLRLVVAMVTITYKLLLIDRLHKNII